MVASDFVFPVSLQVRAADDSSSGAAAAFPAGSSYRVSLPGGLAGRCLREVTESTASNSGSTSGSTGSMAVSLMAVQTGEQQGDAIFCGSLQDAAAAAAQAPAPAAPTGTGSSGSSSAGDAASQQEVPPAAQANEVRSGAMISGQPGLAAVLLAAGLAATVAAAAV